MSKENLFYIFLAMVALVIIIFLNADKLWKSADSTLSPLVNYNEQDNTAIAGSGSADAQTIRTIIIAWEVGNVSITYSDQNRIAWKEVFTHGRPTEFNTMYYWMNTTMISIAYFSQDYSVFNQRLSRDLSKDLIVTIPQGIVMDEITVHTASGTITCEVEAKQKNLTTMSDSQK